MPGGKVFGTDAIRNVALLSHGGVGKTTMTEAIQYYTGAITRMGTVEDGNTVSDYNPEEIERKSSIQLSLVFAEHNGIKINLLDTPGYADFVGETVSAVRVAEAGLMLVSAQAAVEVGTQKAWDYLDGKPCIFLVNRMDRENADFPKALKELKDAFGNNVAPIAIPIGSGDGFTGLVDLLDLKAYSYERGGVGRGTAIDIPDELAPVVEKYRNLLVEAVAESDDALLEKFFERGELSAADLIAGLAAAVGSGRLFPVIPVRAMENIGTDIVLNTIADLLPAPSAVGEVPAKTSVDVEGNDTSVKVAPDGPPGALVWKVSSEAHVGRLTYLKVFSGTIECGAELFNSNSASTERIGTIYIVRGKDRREVEALSAGDIGVTVKLKSTGVGDTLCNRNKKVVFPPVEFPRPVIDVAIRAKSKGEEDKIATGLARLTSEDPTFYYEVDSELKQTLLYGQGELQLELIVKRLSEQFGVAVELTRPRIKYRETIRKSAEAQGRHKKQTGGRGQFADIYLKLQPLPRGEGYEFVNAITGGVVPNKFIPAVDKGIKEILEEGIMAGYRVIDVKATLFDGSYHTVDSSELAFKIAAHLGFKTAFERADPYMLEPIDDVEVIIPEEFTGDVMGDVSSRRGKIGGMEPMGALTKIRAQVPQAELFKYSTVLRSLTQGRGYFTREFSHYAEIPSDVSAQIIEESKGRE